MSVGSPSSAGPQRLPMGLTQDQIDSELYLAWRKDTHEANTPDAVKRYQELLSDGLRDREICFKNSHIGVNVATALGSLLARSSLGKLDLTGNHLQDMGCETISALLNDAPQLTHLAVGGNDMGPQGILILAAVVATHKRLASLDVSNRATERNPNRIDSGSAKTFFEACVRCKTLKRVDCSRLSVGKGGQEAFLVAAKLVATSGTLQTLRLGFSGMSADSALAIVAAVSRSTTLAELDLQGNKLGPKVGEAIGKMLERAAHRRGGVSNSMRVLALNDNLFGPGGVIPIFKAVAVDRSLTTLSLNSTSVDDVAVEILCDSLEANSALTALHLSNNSISEEGAVGLAKAVVGHPGLQTLALAGNKLRDEGVCALAAMIEHNAVLTSLDLDKTHVSDRGAVALGVALANNTSLKTLRLISNHISDDGGSALITLIDKNKTLVNMPLTGNSIFHATSLAATKVIDRNRKLRDDEVPQKLKKELVRLHYRMYKLEEAKAELKMHRNRKAELEQNQDRFEREYREEELAHGKEKKEREDAIRDQETTCASVEQQIKDIQEQFHRFQRTHQTDMELLESRLAQETAEREKAEAEFTRVQQDMATQEEARKTEIEDLKKKIVEAKEDRQRWLQQTRELRGQISETTAKVSVIEDKHGGGAASGVTSGQASARRRSTSRQRRRSSAADKEKGHTSAVTSAAKDIEAFLAAQSADAKK